MHEFAQYEFLFYNSPRWFSGLLRKAKSKKCNHCMTDDGARSKLREGVDIFYFLLFLYGIRGYFSIQYLVFSIQYLFSFSRYSRLTSHLVGCMVSLFEEIISSDILHAIRD
jgi:hypothetical protein